MDSSSLTKCNPTTSGLRLRLNLRYSPITVQPMLPCWVVPTAGSLSISGSLFIQDSSSYNHFQVLPSQV
jgi:hypothetical protein